MKNESDVLDIWVRRGYITQKDRYENMETHLTYIFQAKDEILAYCNIPLAAAMPDGLLYAWADIAWDMRNQAEVGKQPYTVKSVSEGGDSITFAASSDNGQGEGKSVLSNYVHILNRYRRMPI